MRHPSGIVARGAIAGIIGAIVLAAWFLVIDTMRGTPFYTPTFVAGALLNMDAAQPTAMLLAVYTIFHFAAFIMVGIAVTWLLEKATFPPVPMLGFILGFLLFDLIFYAGLVMTGSNVLGQLGWPTVLAGNVLAGLGMMKYLYEASPGEHRHINDVLRDHRTIREGLVAGVIGAVVVMAWFFLVDIVSGRAFFTPGALGSALFYGARGVAEVQIGLDTVLGYTGVHIISFLAIGLIASALVEGARREPHLLLGMVLLFVTLEVLFLGLIAIAAEWLLDAIQWWMIVVANLVAAGAMGAYLLHEHPEVRENLTHDLEEELVES